MQEKLDTLKNNIQNIVKDVKEFVQNKDNSLTERWNIFCKTGELNILPKDDSYFEPNGINWNEYSLYDNFGIDKYQSYTVLDLEEKALDSKIFQKDDEDHIKFKESYLKEFIWEATFNW